MPRKQSGGDQVERSPNAMNARSPMVLQKALRLSVACLTAERITSVQQGVRMRRSLGENSFEISKALRFSVACLSTERESQGYTGRKLIYERENKPWFSLELSHIQFINYSLHIVDIFHISCHDISIVIKSLVTRTNTHLLQYYVSCLVVDYCMRLQTFDSILTSVTIIRHL
jgi:hypothetical protein